MSKKLDDFNHGALLAVSLIVATHDEPGIAADVLHALGRHEADCSGMDEYDKAFLRKIQGERRGLIKLKGLRKTTAATDWVDPDTLELRVTPMPAPHKRPPAAPKDQTP